MEILQEREKKKRRIGSKFNGRILCCEFQVILPFETDRNRTVTNRIPEFTEIEANANIATITCPRSK